MTAGLAHSVQVRLVRHAHALGADPNVVMSRYAAERLLYRLSRSEHAARFVLKGALMLLVWLGESIRPTRDADLLGYGDLDGDALRRTMAEICAIDVHALAMHGPFDGELLAGALRATFERRRTAFPTDPPIALTPAFADIEGKRAQWAGFIRRNRLTDAPADLASVSTAIADFVGPVLSAARRGKAFTGTWPPGGPWQVAAA